MKEAKDVKDKEDGAKGREGFFVEDGCTFKLAGGKASQLCNYVVEIISDMVRDGERGPEERILGLKINLNGTETRLSVTSGEFFSPKLPRKIMEAVGPGAITYCSPRVLPLAIQQLSNEPCEIKRVTRDIGFTKAGHYLANGVLITPETINQNPQTEIDLGGVTLARKINFTCPDDERLKRLASHLCADFLGLKAPNVTYPLIGHICLAPFSSKIYEITGKNKPALHLMGPSGAGKTFLGILAMSFFGTFDDGVVSWSSTPNAIEAEGYLFRDSLFLVNDFKSSCIDRKAAIRVLQNYADGTGRARMSPNSRIQNHTYIRGLLLSTGEDFIQDSESVGARTILIRVPPEKDTEKGEQCRINKGTYPMFLPGLIKSVISDESWTVALQDFVRDRTTIYQDGTGSLSNGLRIAANWALNASGFNMFLKFLTGLGVIDQERATAMIAEYDGMVDTYLKGQVTIIANDGPVEMMFQILGEKFATESISVLNGGEKSKGKIVGEKVRRCAFYLSRYDDGDFGRPLSLRRTKDGLRER